MIVPTSSLDDGIVSFRGEEMIRRKFNSPYILFQSKARSDIITELLL
jgi:hypothetical protein